MWIGIGLLSIRAIISRKEKDYENEAEIWKYGTLMLNFINKMLGSLKCK
jgi:hypothetical protein